MRTLHSLPQEPLYEYLWVIDNVHRGKCYETATIPTTHHLCADKIFASKYGTFYCVCKTCRETNGDKVHYFDSPNLSGTTCPPCKAGNHPRPPV